jgi:RNA recognition motif-containing protein
MARIRPVFCGNFEYDARQSEIERMFTSYGKVDRVDMKTGTFLFSLSLSLSLSGLTFVHRLVFDFLSVLLFGFRMI